MKEPTERRLWVRTAGEELWLLRRSRGEPRKVFAPMLGICETTLWRVETGARALDSVAPGAAWPERGALPERGLCCLLARRRAALGLRQAARRLGRSHVGYLAAERAGDAEVVSMYRAMGFRFLA